MSCFSQLSNLDLYFRDEAKKGVKLKTYYEQVQYVSRIVPRLYLLITIGANFIKSKEEDTNFLLKDLVECCKGVQHPTRGLFLRLYLLQTCGQLLPDKDNDFVGTLGDSLDFVLLNMKEMVNLWARLKKDKEQQREKERLELSDIIGKNLNRISKLEAVDLTVYQNEILPRVLKIIIDSNDSMAQQYLMGCITFAFPDEYLIETIEPFCEGCLQLSNDVSLKNIFVSLMNRLASYFENKKTKDTNFIQVLTKYINQIIEKGEMNSLDVLSVQSSLLSLILKCFRSQTFIVNILNSTAILCEKFTDKNDLKKVAEFLKVPFAYPLICLEIDQYHAIFKFLDFDSKKQVAIGLLNAISVSQTTVSSLKQVTRLFEITSCLTKEDEEKSQDTPELEEEQNLVSRALHLLEADEPEDQLKILAIARKYFGQGGLIRIQYTIPSLIFCYLKLSLTSDNEKIYQYIIETLKVLSQHYPKLAFSLYLNSALTADSKANVKALYATLSEAFLLYEDQDSKSQPSLFIELCNTLMNVKNIKKENFENLGTKLCQYSAKMMRRPDQCKGGLLCSQLFVCEGLNNPDKAIECLNWVLGIIKNCMASEQIPLLVETLNVYIYHFLKGSYIKIESLNSLIQALKTNILELEDEDPEKNGLNTRTYYLNTVAYLKSLTSHEKYKEIKF